MTSYANDARRVFVISDTVNMNYADSKYILSPVLYLNSGIKYTRENGKVDSLFKPV